MVKGWRTVTLRDDLIAHIDAFVETNTLGFTSRGVLVAEVMRNFLEQQREGGPIMRAELERALRAVATLEPETPAALAEALLAELDMKVRHGAQADASKGRSNSDSTKRR